MRRVATSPSAVWLMVLAIAVVLGASALPAAAQVTAGTGVIAGQVTDPSGAMVPGAQITATDTATRDTRTTTTSATGRYILPNLEPGTYVITISKAGFAKAQLAPQEVKVGLTTTINVPLQLGAVSQTVEVKTTGTELQTMNATVGNTVTGTALQSLPSLNRDVSTFVTLQPGVSPDGSVAGTVVDQSSFQLDGGNNTNDMDGSMSVYTPSYAGDPTGGVSNQSFAVAAGPTGVMPTPADSVEQFKVGSANQTADFNSSAGAQVQVVTKRGGSTYHGTLYDYYLDNNFSGNTWDNNATVDPVTGKRKPIPQPNWHRSRFGGALGGTLLPKMLGGKTYFFVNYEGYRWPNSETYERAVPSADMRAGFLTFNDVNGNPVRYNIATLDPRGIGINPLVQQMWNKFMPLSNESQCGLSRCDGVNIQGFKANVAVPQRSDFGVFRVDHDFGDKWHFMSSYRYYKLSNTGTEQVDIGGFFANDKLGTPVSLSNNPQEPWYLVAGMTTNITPNITNDFHYSYLRNWWGWERAGDVPQLDGLGGALEPFGETRNQVLSPYNVNTQQTRTRVWNGKDNYFRDDVTMLNGNHLFQFGGAYQRNWNYHNRTDNGGGINFQPVYQLGTTSGSGIDICQGPAASLVPSSLCDSKSFGRDYAAALGIVSIAQQAFIRSGPNLTLQPPGVKASATSVIPYYNVYFSDTWHLKPTFTLTYGLGWTLEMPPFEKDGNQMVLVNDANQLISVESYLHSREAAALKGEVYNPNVGFSLVRNAENGRKYPYDPFYGGFSPRLAAAWNPHFSGDGLLGHIFGTNDSVFRAGYSRIYGRLNGVDQILVPLLAPGIIQPLQCFGALAPTAVPPGGNPCAGSGLSTPSNAFRIGIDGLTAPLPASTQTLPQPYLPGINNVAAAAGEALDPHFRPNNVDTVTFSFQRQLSSKVTMELGYIGRWIHHEYQPINIDSVPYMMTLGGQRFDKAYANVALQYCGGIAGLAGTNCAKNAAAVTPQPFFETALAGTGFCNGFANCTQALVSKEGGNLASQQVWSLWSDLDNGGTAPGFNFARSMQNTPLNCPTGAEIGCNGQLTSGVGINASLGYGNYNAGYASIRMNDWHGLTTQSNFTWSKALSTQAVVQATSEDTAVDPFNLRTGYGLAGFDRKFVYNLFFVYTPPIYKGQQGLVGHLLGGWTFAPIFTAGTGLPVTLGTFNGGGQAFGEGDSVNFFGNGNSENAIPIGHLSTGLNFVPGSNGIGTEGFGVNLFKDPAAAFNLVRQPILGLDTRDGGWGVIRGLGYWNVDLSVRKGIKVTERVGFEAQAVFTNVFNHPVFFDPGPGSIIDTSTNETFGTLPGQGNDPRRMEFGLRLNF